MKVKKLKLQAYYDLNGEYLVFPDNPLHGKIYENVDVTIGKWPVKVGDETFEVDVITISGQEPIECELVSRRNQPDGTMVLSICQDWG